MSAETENTLEALRAAHEALLAGIQELEEATRAPMPDASALAGLRWRLSRASGRRRRLVDRACAELLGQASPGMAAELELLREGSADMLAATSRHVGTWTIEQVLADWDGYRAASTEMRKAMRARIAKERAVLYPLLEAAMQRA